MPKYHEFAQYSDDYDKIRLGLPTSSKFDKIITPTGKAASGWQTYAHHLIAERLLGNTIHTYSSPYMQVALEMESDAVAFYESMREVDTLPIGFVTTDDGKTGCSPDRLIGDDGLLEIKCPEPQTQVGYLLTGEPEKKYYPQLQGQLYVTGREWVDICAFHYELPPCVVRIERDEPYLEEMDKYVTKFNEYISSVMDKISSMHGLKETEKMELQF